MGNKDNIRENRVGKQCKDFELHVDKKSEFKKIGFVCEELR